MTRLAVCYATYSLVMAVVAFRAGMWLYTGWWLTSGFVAWKAALWLARESLLRAQEYD